MMIPFGGIPYQLIAALIIGVVLGSVKADSRSEAANWGGKLSFILGAGIVVFYDRLWSPITLSLLNLVSWVLTGWLVAVIGYEIGTRLSAFFRRF
jgi:hypothetical protein